MNTLKMCKHPQSVECSDSQSYQSGERFAESSILVLLILPVLPNTPACTFRMIEFELLTNSRFQSAFDVGYDGSTIAPGLLMLALRTALPVGPALPRRS